MEVKLNGISIMSSVNSNVTFGSALEAAQYVPEQYLKLLADGEGSAIAKEEMNFLIRRSDIKNLRSYVREARLLPVNLSAIQRLVGYQNIGISELEPASIQQFNQRVVQHADSWGTLERDTKELARQLDTFAGKFLGSGNHLLEIIKKVELERLLGGTLEALTDSEIAELSQVLLNATERKAISIIKSYLKQMWESTQGYIKRATEVGHLAAAFERTLTEELIPTMEIKVRAYEGSPLATEQKELLEALKELDERIETLAREYSAYVGYAFSGLVIGPLGLVVTGGIFGEKAEKTRATKNAEVEKRKKLRQESDENQKLINLLDGVHVNLVDLRGRMLGAEVGAKQLAQVWSYIGKYLEEASRGLDDINHLAALHAFALEFALALNPWKQIGNYSTQISTAFNEALEDFN